MYVRTYSVREIVSTNGPGIQIAIRSSSSTVVVMADHRYIVLYVARHICI